MGIYTIAKSNFEHTFLKEINGPHDRYTVLDIDLPGIARFLLIHLNAPNQDIPEHARKWYADFDWGSKCATLYGRDL